MVLWRHVASGERGPEALEKRQEIDREAQEERERKQDDRMRVGKPAEANADEAMAMKMLKELEGG